MSFSGLSIASARLVLQPCMSELSCGVRKYSRILIMVIINYRYYLIQKARDAQVVGIVVGTLGVGK